MKKLFVVSIAALSILACGKGKSNNPFKAVQQAAGDKDLQHTFATECAATPKDMAWGAVLKLKDFNATIPVAMTTQYKFEGDSVTRTDTYFSDNTCKSGKIYDTAIIGEYERETDSSKKSNDGGRPIDLKWNVAYVTPTPEGVALLNAANFCGNSQYQAKSEEITKQAKNSDCLKTELPVVQHNIYRVDDKNLTLGDGNVKANSTGERPTSQSKTVYKRI